MLALCFNFIIFLYLFFISISVRRFFVSMSSDFWGQKFAVSFIVRVHIPVSVPQLHILLVCLCVIFSWIFVIAWWHIYFACMTVPQKYAEDAAKHKKSHISILASILSGHNIYQNVCGKNVPNKFENCFHSHCLNWHTLTR